MLDGQQRFSAHNHWAFPGEVERHNRDVFEMDVLPYVELSPIRKREHTNRFAFIDARVINVPQLGTLILRIPLPEAVTERIDTLFGPRLFLVPAGAAKSGIKPVFGQTVQQSSRFQESTALLGAELVRVSGIRKRF